MKPLPSQAELVELFDYSLITGTLYHKQARHGVTLGTVAGTLSHGYCRLRVNGQLYQAHRLIWIYVTGLEPHGEIDHIDGNRANNAWHNLRDVSASENGHNQHGLRSHNTTGFIGVERAKAHGRYRARITINNVKITIGTFPTAEEASCAREAFKAEHIPN